MSLVAIIHYAECFVFCSEFHQKFMETLSSLKGQTPFLREGILSSSSVSAWFARILETGPTHCFTVRLTVLAHIFSQSHKQLHFSHCK